MTLDYQKYKQWVNDNREYYNACHRKCQQKYRDNDRAAYNKHQREYLKKWRQEKLKANGGES